MIGILHSDSVAGIAEMIANGLSCAYNEQIAITRFLASSASKWSPEPRWDDILLVIYDGATFPPNGLDFIRDYMGNRRNGLVLPVSTVSNNRKPPSGADHIKAFECDSPQTSAGALVARVGAMIGLRLQHRENEIFISYRATDGKAQAEQLEKYLTSIGYPTWRDEANDIDGATKILPGSKVQNDIDRALERAAVVVLLDTPDAAGSKWIKHEIDTANGVLVPVLPICFRASEDRRKGPRFSSLVQLQRWVDISHTVGELTELELSSIVAEMEIYLSEILRRKCRVPFIVEREFTSRNFEWRELDRRHLIAESIKGTGSRVPTRIVSHCSIFDHVYGPSLDRFAETFRQYGTYNHSLYIYDGELIPEIQLCDIVNTRPLSKDVVVLHHQELAALIDSNFTAL